jgi:nicotinamide riboside transporter PnuC
MKIVEKKDPEEGVQTIQLTKKKWKRHIVIASVLMLVGLYFLFAGLSSNPGWAILGGFLIFIGFIWGLVARFGAWWSTG